MTEADFINEILQIIKNYSGINTGDAHKDFVCEYSLRHLNELSISREEYLGLLKSDVKELKLLINSATINETYFFREESQFDFLKNEYFPANKDRQLNIWSAACSTGQEPLSIQALCLAENVNAKIYASDIDTDAINSFRTHRFSIRSFRTDGIKYRQLLTDKGTVEDEEYIADSSLFSSIEIFTKNLADKEDRHFLNESLDIIFIRNVFIYFTPELRKQILKEMAGLLKENGILFTSVNEVPSVNFEWTPELPLVKEHSGPVYYFRKVSVKPETSPMEKKSFSAWKNDSYKDEVQNISDMNIQKSESNATEINCKSKSMKDLICHCESFFSALENNRINDAEDLINKWPFSISAKEFHYYLKGMLAKKNNDNTSAEEHFFKSGLVNQDFWPSFFQMGLLQMKRSNNKDAERSFRRCIIILEKYVEQKKVCYNSIIEDFTPEYILELCKGYGEQLASSEN